MLYKLVSEALRDWRLRNTKINGEASNKIWHMQLAFPHPCWKYEPARKQTALFRRTKLHKTRYNNFKPGYDCALDSRTTRLQPKQHSSNNHNFSCPHRRPFLVHFGAHSPPLLEQHLQQQQATRSQQSYRLRCPPWRRIAAVSFANFADWIDGRLGGALVLHCLALVVPHFRGV